MIYEVGNMIYNNLVFMADADTAGAALLYEDPLARDPDRVLSETAE